MGHSGVDEVGTEDTVRPTATGWQSVRPVPRPVIDLLLGEPEWAWIAVQHESGNGKCQGAGGLITSAGFGRNAAAMRVYIHSNQTCLGGGMFLYNDVLLAELIARWWGQVLDIRFEPIVAGEIPRLYAYTDVAEAHQVLRGFQQGFEARGGLGALKDLGRTKD